MGGRQIIVLDSTKTYILFNKKPEMKTPGEILPYAD